jgi:hypothetical protein
MSTTAFDCLSNAVNVLGCSSTATRIYLNSLPGINLESIEGISDREQGNYLGVISDVKSRSYRKFISDVTIDFSKRYKLRQIYSSIDMGKNLDLPVSVTAPASNTYRGTYINLDFPSTLDGQYKRSALQSLHINKAYFYCHSSANSLDIHLSVFDYDTNENLATFSLTGASDSWVEATNSVSGINDFGLNVSGRRIAILISNDAGAYTNISCYKTTTEDSTLNLIDVHGINFTAAGSPSKTRPLSSNSTFDNNSNGISLVFGVRCSYENIICNNLDLFVTPWLYLLGSELMLERMYSPRKNQWTMNKKDAMELKGLYDAEYEKARKQIIENITLDESDPCIECGAAYNLKESPFFSI